MVFNKVRVKSGISGNPQQPQAYTLYTSLHHAALSSPVCSLGKGPQGPTVFPQVCRKAAHLVRLLPPLLPAGPAHDALAFFKQQGKCAEKGLMKRFGQSRRDPLFQQTAQHIRARGPII